MIKEGDNIENPRMVLGAWEPSIDPEIWNKKNELHVFVQNVGQGDSETLEKIPAQMISILEWQPFQ